MSHHMRSGVRKAASQFDSDTVQMMKLFRENVRKDITGTNDLIVAVKERLNDCDLNLASMKQLTSELNLEFASIANKVSKLDMSMKKARTDDLAPIGAGGRHHRVVLSKHKKATTKKSVVMPAARAASICSSSSSSSLSSIGLDDSGKCASSSSMVRSNTCSSSLGPTMANPAKRARRALKTSASAHSSLDTTLSWTTGSSKYDECDNSDELCDNGYGESLIDHDDTFNDIDDDLKTMACRRVAIKRVETTTTDEDDDDDDDDGDEYTDEDDDEVVTPLRNSFDDKLLNENCNQLIETLLQKTIAASL